MLRARHRLAQPGLGQVTGRRIAITAFVNHGNHGAAIDCALRRFGNILPHRGLFGGFLDQPQRAEINGGKDALESGFE